ncbi:MAG: Rieske 2Fe-2S domain-containing protein [Verrucomicrobia bacterium]|nr:Rieske 2Fe-2S domain-containing protein [Verrucomicrobiota bacterium]
MKRLRVIAAKELKNGSTVKFEFQRGGVQREGFVVRFKGKLAAFENVCRHIPIALDAAGGEFFGTDGKHFVCQTHGAVYEPLTGLCVRGPCEGASLKRIEVEVCDGFVEALIDECDGGDDWRHTDWR